MADVRFEGVSKAYGSNAPTIRKLDLHVRDGEFMVLVGPSGCGKSTTLRMVAGLEDATSGTLSIGDRVVNDVAPKDRDIAMVFQNYALYPHMDVRRNMAFGLKLRKFDPSEIDSRVREAAVLLEIEELLDRKPRELSGGQRQRVALGRAIVRKPQVFLFDEPLSNLDAKLRVQMRTEIKKLHRQLGTTMIYVTHDQVEAMTMGDRITVMKDGDVHQVAAPIELYNNPADTFVAGFIGSPWMNFIPARVIDDGSILLIAGELPITVPEDHRASLADFRGRDITLGLRPEFVRSTPASCAHPAHIVLQHEMSELLGNEMYMYLSTDKLRVIGRSTTVQSIEMGATVDMYFDMARAHYFEGASGTRLTLHVH